MTESSCAGFLRWALPRLSLEWEGFRRVRRQVCRRVGRRVEELRLPDLGAYRRHLEAHAEEWALLDSFCRVPISRFLRDRAVFDRLAADVLPALAETALARGASRLRCWSAGCASGEEPYSLAILWKLALAARFRALSLAVLATDIDEGLLARARQARYRSSSLRELPAGWVAKAFTRSDGLFELRPEFRAGVEFLRQDVREETPSGPFDLVLCRNLVFTYFDAPLRRRTLERILQRLAAGGALVLGLREMLPESAADLAVFDARLKIYQRPAGRSERCPPVDAKAEAVRRAPDAP